MERIVDAAHVLFRYPGGHVSAIRLYGAANAYVLPEDLHIEYEPSAFDIPVELKFGAEQRIRELEELQERINTKFFDGPNVRLISWRGSPPRMGPGATLERDALTLVLGPVGWYAFEGTNGVLRRRLDQTDPEPYEKWVELSQLVKDRDVRHSKLSNILGNAITIFTRDGKVGYQERGMQQSAVPGMVSSAVAENTNRYFDEVDPQRSLEPINFFTPDMNLSEGPDNDYPPTGVPHPFAAVRRGLQEETFSRVLEYIPQFGIKFTGLTFGLDVLHPDALWIVLVELSAEEFTRMCKESPGKDWSEGRIRFVPADFADSDTKLLLQTRDWVPGGKASLVRAIQLLDETKLRLTGKGNDPFEVLAAAR